ncbi:MAG: DUF4097 domain-containing protein [Clostridiales bacterium]|nr:DUF4097 domain-containing protein [Clostridiales bacterium]
MELIKNMLKYLLILLVIVVGALSLVGGIMFLFPNITILNFKYIANHTDEYVLFQNKAITKINVETNNYNIIIMPNSEKNVSNNTQFKIVVDNDFMGFANQNYEIKLEIPSSSDEKEYVNVSDFNEVNFANFYNDGEITLKLVEPTGLVSYLNSQIIFYIPETATNIEYNVKTNAGSILFAQNSNNPSKKLSTSDIDIHVSSVQGSFNLDNAKMEDGSDLVISNYIGKVNINSDNIGNVIIDSNSGNFTFKNIGYNGFDGGNLTINGNNPYVRANTIYGDVEYDSTTGFLQAKQINGDAIISTENGIIRIDKALGGIQLSNNSGETTIKQIGEADSTSKSVSINSKSGAITLGGRVETSSDTEEQKKEPKGIYWLNNINAQSSKIIITNLYASESEIVTTTGSVLVNFGESDDTKNLNVETRSGAITLNNIYGKINASTQKSSKIKASFNKIATGETSTFKTIEGAIELTLPAPTDNTEKQYNLSLKSRRNRVNVNIGNFSLTSFEGEKDSDQYYNFTRAFPQNAATTNTISLVTNSGTLVVKE